MEDATGAGAGDVVVGAGLVVAVVGAAVVVVGGLVVVVVVVAAPAPTAPMTPSDGPHAMTAAAANTTLLVEVNLKTIETLPASALPPSRRLYRPMARKREPQRTNFVQFSAWGTRPADAT